MDPFKKPKSAPEENPESSEVLEASEVPEEALEGETGLVSGEVSEIAKDHVSETKAQGQGKAAQVQDDKKKEPDLSDRLALRDRLLAAAPKESAMRSEVREVLMKEKEKLESDVKKFKRKRNYALLSEAVAQLRYVVKQLQELAHAGYEALKEIWLKVVHRFA